MAEPKARPNEKEQAAKAAPRTERKVQPKADSRPVRRDTNKGSSSMLMRFRNSRIGRFIYEAYYELRYKVTWPTFVQARNMTLIVIALSVAVGLILGLADYGLYNLFLLISGSK